jgi:hypothetical protein
MIFLVSLALLVNGFLTAAESCQFLPDDVWKIVAYHAHAPVVLCLNKLFRNHYDYIDINTPIRLKMQCDADDASEGTGAKNKREFFYRGIQNGTIRVHDKWILEDCILCALMPCFHALRNQEVVDMKLCMNANDFYDVYIGSSYLFNGEKPLRELSILYESITPIHSHFFKFFGARIAHNETLRKFSFHMDRLKIGGRFLITPQHICSFKDQIAKNTMLQEVTFTVERNVIRLHPFHDEDLQWFQFVCRTKKPAVNIEWNPKWKLPWWHYWSGDPTKRM